MARNEKADLGEISPKINSTATPLSLNFEQIRAAPGWVCAECCLPLELYCFNPIWGQGKYRELCDTHAQYFLGIDFEAREELALHG
ncbi:MAG: hypothetical protein ABIU09_13465 [Pyrinomonadaceae bacterium]